MPKKNPYDAGSMELAINEVKANTMGLRAAAKKYGVPKSTLEFKLKNPGHKETCGPSPILTSREESQLENWIQELASRGFPRNKDDILTSVQRFLMENPRPNPFKNNRPGDRWFKAFLRRHPSITQRTSEAVSSASACVSETDIRKWFNEIRAYFNSKNIEINDPSRIYNGDETGFQICPSTGKVFAGKGAKNVYSIDKGSQKENITVMFTFSASGTSCPPMIIYPYKRIPEKIAVTVNSNWGIGRSDNGWMTSETFFDYIKNIFYPYLIENHVEFPVILFLDGHKSHLTYELSILCNDLGIEVISLYPNATRILQPCDVAVFRPIKMGWKKAVKEFYEEHPGQILNKITFAPLLEKVVTDVIRPETLINGFRACGIFPLNPDAVDYSKCLGKSITPVEVTNAEPVSIDKTKFLNFVGENLIAKFKSYDAILIKEEFNNEFLALHRMWNYLGKPNKENKIKSNKNQNIGDESKNPDRKLENKEREQLLQNTKILETNIPTSTSDIDLISISEETEAERVHVIANVIIREGGNAAETAALPKSNIMTDLNLKCNSERSEDNSIKNISHSSDLLISNQNNNDRFSSTSCLPSTSKFIGDYLHIPDKPQRKNKRQTERVSFAITSKSYQQSFEAKRALKLEEENKKLERKRQREEKAAEKATSKKSRKLQVKNEPICFVCNKRLNAKTQFLTCDSCKNNFHYSCIPKEHKKHIPDLEDDDLFMCFNCFKETSEEEESDEGMSEENSEEFEMTKSPINQAKDEQEKRQENNEQDEQEVDELFNMYKTEYSKYY